MNKLIALATVLWLVIAFAMLSGLSKWALLDTPSLLLIAGVVGAGVAFSFGPAMAFRVFVPFGVKRLAEDNAQRDLYSRALRRASQLSYAAALLGFMTGAIAILSEWSDMAHAGAGFAVALLCPLYGVLFSVFLFDGTRTSVEALKRQTA